MTDNAEQAPDFNALLRADNPRHVAKQDAARVRLFGPDPEPVSPTGDKPLGSANGGEGEPDHATYDSTADGQRFRVYDL